MNYAYILFKKPDASGLYLLTNYLIYIKVSIKNTVYSVF